MNWALKIQLDEGNFFCNGGFFPYLIKTHPLVVKGLNLKLLSGKQQQRLEMTWTLKIQLGEGHFSAVDDFFYL